jgi:hypothetical protein
MHPHRIYRSSKGDNENLLKLREGCYKGRDGPGGSCSREKVLSVSRHLKTGCWATLATACLSWEVMGLAAPGPRLPKVLVLCSYLFGQQELGNGHSLTEN